jgi:hypothetical protein
MYCARSSSIFVLKKLLVLLVSSNLLAVTILTVVPQYCLVSIDARGKLRETNDELIELENGKVIWPVDDLIDVHLHQYNPTALLKKQFKDQVLRQFRKTFIPDIHYDIMTWSPTKKDSYINWLSDHRQLHSMDTARDFTSITFQNNNTELANGTSRSKKVFSLDNPIKRNQNVHPIYFNTSGENLDENTPAGSIKECLLDTGADVSIMASTTATLLNLSMVTAPEISVSGFKGKSITLTRACRAFIRHGRSKPVEVIFYLIDDLATPILGTPALDALGISLSFNSISRYDPAYTWSPFGEEMKMVGVDVKSCRKQAAAAAFKQIEPLIKINKRIGDEPQGSPHPKAVYEPELLSDDYHSMHSYKKNYNAEGTELVRAEIKRLQCPDRQ